MSGKPRILFLSQSLPFPPDGGVQIRTFNVLRLLAREYDVTALCFYRSAAHPSIEAVRASLSGLEEFATVEAFPIPQEHSRSRLVRDHLRSVVSRQVYTVAAYESESFRARLKELLRSRSFDLVHMDSLDLSGYLPLLSDLPLLCVHHNVESILLRRRAEQATSRLMRSYLAFQAKLMEQEERRWADRVGQNVVVSDEDGVALASIAPNARIATVPNGVDTRQFIPRDTPRAGLIFVGGYSWYPNRDAMTYFCEAILPILRERSKGVSVKWVGGMPVEVRDELASGYGVDATGYVEDIRPHVQAAVCYIVPLRVGGGTRLKILDAWAMGKAVVSTSVGCEGLDATDGENILIRDTPGEFAEAVEAVCTDHALRVRLETNARRTAEAIYDWDVIGSDMLPIYRDLVR